MGCTASRSAVETQAGRGSSYTQLSRSFSTPIQARDGKYDLVKNKHSESYHMVALTSSTYGSLRLDSQPHLEEARMSVSTYNPAEEIYRKIKNSMDLPAVTMPKPWYEVSDSLPKPPMWVDAEDTKLLNGADRDRAETINMWELMEGLEEESKSTEGLPRKPKSIEQANRKSSPFDRSRTFTTIHTVEDLDGGVDVRKSLPADYSFRRGSSLETVIPPRKSQEFVLDTEKVHQTSSAMLLRRRSLARTSVSRSQEFSRLPYSSENHQAAPGIDVVARRKVSRSQEFPRLALRKENYQDAPGMDPVPRRSVSRSQESARPPLPKPKELIYATHENYFPSDRPPGVVKKQERTVALSQPDPVLRSPMLRGLSGHERLRPHTGQQSPVTKTALGKPSGSNHTRPSFSLDASPTSESTKQSVPQASAPKTVGSESTVSTSKGTDPSPSNKRTLEAAGKSDVGTKRPSSLPRIAVSRPTDYSDGASKTLSVIKPMAVTKQSSTPSYHLKDASKDTVSLQDTGSKKPEVATPMSGATSSESHKRLSPHPAALPKTSTSEGSASTQEIKNPAAVDKAPSKGQQKTGRRSPPLAPRIASAIAALSVREAIKSLSLDETSLESSAAVTENERHSSAQAAPGPRVVVFDAVPSKLGHPETHSSNSVSPISAGTCMDDTRMTSAQAPTIENTFHPTTQATPKVFSFQQAEAKSSLPKTATGSHGGQRTLPVLKPSTASSLQLPRTASRGSETGYQGILEDPIGSDFEHISHAEAAAAAAHTGLIEDSSANAKVQLSDKTTIWSDFEHPDSPPLDPELLASFEEALELFSADDWCNVRIGEGDVAVASGRSSDADSPSWSKETPFLPEKAALAGETVVKGNKILEDHIEQQSLQQANAKRVASSKVAPLEDEEQKVKAYPLEKFDKKCPPGGEDRCVLYTTSLRGIRKTFEDCSRLRMILQGLNVLIDERDIAMHAEFRQELKDLTGKPVPVPRLFINGRYIGGAEEVSQLHEEGILGTLLEGLPTQISRAVCGGCGGVRFVPCSECSGSCKVINDDNKVSRCTDCNENGLMRCPICF